MSAGTNNQVTLPSDFFKVLSVRDDTGSKTTLEPMDFRTFERDIADPAEQGLLEVYCTIGVSKLLVWRCPDVTTNLHIVYMESLAVWNDDLDELPGPVECHYTIVRLAKAIGLQDENEEDRASSAQDQAAAAIARLWSKYSSVNDSDSQQVVQDVMGYG